MDSSRMAGALLLAIVAGGLWLGFVRQAPAQTALATITSKGYVAGSTYTQLRVGANRGFNAPTNIAIADANAFELRVDGMPDVVRASFNTIKSRRFDVGQRVRVQFTRRGIPPLWERIVVLDMTPADPH